MATLVATFTTAADAERAAAALRERGLSNVTVGLNPGGMDSVVGLGATSAGLRQGALIFSTIGGTLTLGGLGGFLGLVAAGFPEFRNMGTPAYIPSALSITLIFVVAGLALGLVAGLLGGLVLAPLLGNAADQAVAEGYGPPRPQLTVSVASRREDDLACATLREFGPPFEIARLREAAPRPARA